MVAVVHQSPHHTPFPIIIITTVIVIKIIIITIIIIIREGCGGGSFWSSLEVFEGF